MGRANLTATAARRQTPKWLFLGLCLVTGWMGCQERRVYTVKGVVQEIMDGGTPVRIAHEAIPGYMPAMIMPFDAKDPAETSRLKPGDVVQFQLVVTANRGWIEGIKVIGFQKLTNAPPASKSIRITPVADLLKIGDVLPDYPLTNELGQPVTFRQFRGQALALTFIFTRCTFPEFCLRMTSQFEEMARRLTARDKGPANWHLLSISFDTEFDTPPVLREYARRHRADSARWNFVTASATDMEKLTEQFGLTYEKSPALFDHDLRTVVVDTQGRIQRIFTGNKWTAEELAAELVKAAAVPVAPATNSSPSN